MTIFEGNPRARHFRTIYVDAFAGSGSRVKSNRRVQNDEEPGFPELSDDSEVTSFFDGSARIALAMEKPFSSYLFVEQDASYAKELRKLVAEFPDRNVEIRSSDANSVLEQWCQNTDWRTHRSVVFLDPYGMQVQWSTIQSLGSTKGVDLWYLFPLGQAVNRLLTKAEPPSGRWAAKLTELFGTDEWQSEFYKQSRQDDLFATEPQVEKDASWDRIEAFLLDRLSTCFSKVARPRRLSNSKGVPIFLLCFAAANPRGADLAVRIAEDILGA